MKDKIVTLRDIANELNISVTTVNRALTGKGRVSEKTRNDVFMKSEELGYKPNVFAKALSSKEQVKIGIICPLDLYFEDVVEGINTFYKELSHYNVKIVFKHYDVYDISKQLEQINECVEEKVDGIMIAAAHPILLNKVISELYNNDIPVITFNNDAPDSKRLCFVGQNAATAGRMAGELMSRFIKAESRVAIMTSLSVGQGLKSRVESFVKYIKACSKKIDIVGPFEYYDNSESSKQIAREVIRNANVDGIYVNNMEGTRGLGRAAKELGIRDQMIFIGHDSNEEIDSCIEDGIIDATLLQDPFSQGYYTFKLMFEYIYLKKNIYAKTFYTKTYILMKSNLSEKRRWNEVFYTENEC